MGSVEVPELGIRAPDCRPEISRHAVHRRVWLPGSGEKPFPPSARAGQLDLRTQKIPPDFRPGGSSRSRRAA